MNIYKIVFKFLLLGILYCNSFADDIHEIPYEEINPFEAQHIYNVETPEITSELNNSIPKMQPPGARAIIKSELIQLNYAKAFDVANILKDKSSSMLSAHGSLRIDPRTNSILIKDTIKKITEIKELIQKLDIPISQVAIEARIVNVTKDNSKDVGIRLGLTTIGLFSGTLEGVYDCAVQEYPPLNNRLNLNLPAAAIDATPASFGFVLSKLGGGVLLDLELSALESEGQAEIVASPKLVTTNNQEAIIESGEDIPYQQATLSGATAVAFKKAVLSLKVKPQITPDNRLLMNLVVNQDFDSGRRVQGVPIILTKSITTSVLVKDGETLVLGGIYKKDKHNVVVKVPVLGNIPLLGVLFRRIQVRFKNEELLIFITPKILKQ